MIFKVKSVVCCVVFLFGCIVCARLIVYLGNFKINWTRHDDGPRRMNGGSGTFEITSTVDDFLYFHFGDGTSNDEHLTRYIRSQIARPSPLRPRALMADSSTVSRGTEIKDGQSASPPSWRKDYSQIGQSLLVDKLLGGRRNGFFVECGAADGESYSNSLYFELERNWTGLLVEANPSYHRDLLTKNRRAYVLNACLSPTRRPGRVRFRPLGVFGGIIDRVNARRGPIIRFPERLEPDVTVGCFPLNAVLAALGVEHVDYLSLDVEGVELNILETVNWTRFSVDVLTVERPSTEENRKRLRELLVGSGRYEQVEFNSTQDFVFLRRQTKLGVS